MKIKKRQTFELIVRVDNLKFTEKLRCRRIKQAKKVFLSRYPFLVQHDYLIISRKESFFSFTNHDRYAGTEFTKAEIIED